MIKKLLLSFALFMGLLMTAFAQIPTEGLVGYYRLDNGTYEDSSGEGNDLVAGGVGAFIPVDNRFGEPEKALFFINDYLQNSDPTTFSFDGADGEMSLSLWFFLGEDVLNFTALANKWGGFGTGGYYLGINPDNQAVRWNINVDPPIETPSISTGTWYHLVATYDGFIASLYLDGILESSMPYGVEIGATDFLFMLGTQSNDPGVSSFPGNMDDVLIYNRALTEDEVQGIFTILSVENYEAFSSSIIVAPNPTNDEVYVDYDQSLGLIRSYTLMSIDGRILSTEVFLDQNVPIHLGKYPAGVYFISLKTRDGVSVTRKIIKK